MKKYQKDPVAWAKDILGVKLWSMQEDILRAMVDGNVVVKSGHGMGKDFIGAVIILWFLCNFKNSKIITTAPCFDKETEILTTNGWKLLSELTRDDLVATRVNGKLVYEKPLELHKYKVSGKMIGHKSRDIDFLVTPNHKLFVKKNWYKCGFEKVEAKDVYGKWFNSFNREVVWEGNEDTWSEKHYELWGFWFADGYCRVGGKNRRCDVTLTQKNFPDYARELLSVYGKNIGEYKRNDGAINFAIYDKKISSWFYNNFMPNGEKRIPSFIKNATKDKLQAFIHGVIMGDGDKKNDGTDRIRVYGDEQFANDLQEICLKAGYVCNIHKRNLLYRESFQKNGRIIKGKPTIEYGVSILSQRKMFPRSSKPSWYKKQYDDYVYCVTVSSGIVLVRRNGTYHWSGNSARQVEKVIWGEVSRLYYQAKVPLGGKLMSQELRISPSWYALGFTTKETNSSVGKAQGFHAPHQLVVITEAQAVDESIYEQLDGVLTSNHSRKYIAGNPLMAQGHFWRIFNDPKVGKEYQKFTFSCFDAPNVKENKDIFPGMVSYEWVEACRAKWGEDSPLWEGRVLGQFPRVSVQTLLSMDECIRATQITKPAKGIKVLAIDPARFGDDSTGICLVNGGRMEFLSSENGKATPETEGEILNLIYEHQPDLVIIDEGAMGGGIYDHVSKELEDKDIVEVQTFNFGGRPSDSKFANIGTEAYFTVSENIKKGLIKLEDNQDLFNQLCSRKYGFSVKGQLIIEAKKDMKKRGFPSPDLSDSACMAFYHSITDEVETKSDEEVDDEDIEIAFMDADIMTKYPKREEVDKIFL